MRVGDSVLLDIDGSKTSFVVLKASAKCKISKHLVPLEPLIGAPWDSMFELTMDGKALTRVREPLALRLTRMDAASTSSNNSKLTDDNHNNQTLSDTDIQRMKAEGQGGQAIISALCAHSKTFDTKTQFSQTKYIVKKAGKYLKWLTARRPTAAAVCEAHFAKNPAKVFNLRPDTLAIMLTAANVGPHARVLLMDGVGGIITGAVAQAMAHTGLMCATYLGEKPKGLEAITQFNLSPEDFDIMYKCPLSSLSDALAAAGSEATAPTPASEATAPTPVSEATAPTPALDDVAISMPSREEPPLTADPATSSPAEAVNGGGGDVAMAPAPSEPEGTELEVPPATQEEGGGAVPPASAEGAPSGAQQGAAPVSGAGGAAQIGGSGRRSPRVPSHEQLAAMVASGFTSAAIAVPDAWPVGLLHSVLPLLQPSAPFVLYSPWLQPLVEAFGHLQRTKGAVLLELRESWWRKHQVLPNRTHPTMSTTGTGGYILSGIKVLNDGVGSEGEQRAGGGKRKGGGRRGRPGGKRGRS